MSFDNPASTAAEHSTPTTPPATVEMIVRLRTRSGVVPLTIVRSFAPYADPSCPPAGETAPPATVLTDAKKQRPNAAIE